MEHVTVPASDSALTDRLRMPQYLMQWLTSHPVVKERAWPIGVCAEILLAKVPLQDDLLLLREVVPPIGDLRPTLAVESTRVS
jgi:hypothetical protein